MVLCLYFSCFFDLLISSFYFFVHMYIPDDITFLQFLFIRGWTSRHEWFSHLESLLQFQLALWSFYSQAISYSDPRTKAILIFDNLCCIISKLPAFSVIKCCLVMIVSLVPSGCNLCSVYLITWKKGADMLDNLSSSKT